MKSRRGCCSRTSPAVGVVPVSESSDDDSAPIRVIARAMDRTVAIGRAAVTRVGVLVAPSLAAAMGREHVDPVPAVMDKRDAFVALLAVGLGGASFGVAELLVRAITLVTNLAFYQRL